MLMFATKTSDAIVPSAPNVTRRRWSDRCTTYQYDPLKYVAPPALSISAPTPTTVSTVASRSTRNSRPPAVAKLAKYNDSVSLFSATPFGLMLDTVTADPPLSADTVAITDVIHVVPFSVARTIWPPVCVDSAAVTPYRVV